MRTPAEIEHAIERLRYASERAKVEGRYAIADAFGQAWSVLNWVAGKPGLPGQAGQSFEVLLQGLENIEIDEKRHTKN